MLVANLEQLLAKDKIRWGRRLLEEIDGPACKHQLLWSISRLGSRELLYGPADRVIPPEEAVTWCRKLMDIPWSSPKHAVPAVARMARMTGDRIRDLSLAQRENLLGWMTLFQGTESHLRLLKEVIPMAAEEESSLFGESLPSGLLLRE
jgi:DNA-K related protein